MTVQDIADKIAEIKAEANDDESAHCDEDDLHLAVLKAIADGAPNPAELAAEAIKTREIRFWRWCA